MHLRSVAGLLALFLAAPLGAAAQANRVSFCSSQVSRAQYCNGVVDALVTTQTRAGLASVAGNPLPGAASTLGMRIGTLPRISVSARFTAVESDLLAIERATSTGEFGRNHTALALDGAVGIYSGLSFFPTVGGFGSLDLLVGLGTSLTSNENGFSDGNGVNWSVGARVGILQESFTAPGISLTAKYARVPTVDFGDPDLARTDAFFRLTDNSVMSARAIVGKRLFVLSAAAGIGYDRYTSDVLLRVRTLPAETGIDRGEVFESDLTNSRMILFGDLQFTLLVLSIVAEGGWQRGDSFPAPLRAGQAATSEQGAAFLSLALRLTI